MSNCLVTGGAGFIGSNLVGALLERGHSVRVIDDFSTGYRHNLTPYEGKIELLEGDLAQMEIAQQAVDDIDLIFHKAALPSVPRSISDPIESNRAGVDATLNLLISARDAGVKRLVYASSSSVYGDQDPDKAKVETMVSQPISPYGVSKMAAERYCQVFHIAYGFEAVALRYFNVFGPGQDPSGGYAAVIPKFATAMLSGQQPTIYGDGEQTRDFTYIGNVIHGNLLAAEAPAEKVAGEVFNLAAGGQTSLNELVEMMQEFTGFDQPAKHDPPRTGDIRHSRADISKAQQRMGYEPVFTMLEGLRKTVDWYREQAS